MIRQRHCQGIKAWLTAKPRATQCINRPENHACGSLENSRGEEREREAGHVTIIEIRLLISTDINCTHTTVFWTTWVRWCQKKSSSGLYGAEDNRPDMPTIQLGATPSRLIRDPPPSSPQFYTGCPS